jgi:hypothetical protein
MAARGLSCCSTVELSREAYHYQNITVVPDSGIGQLVGLAGTMLIIIADGKHCYRFDYTLPEST